MDDGPFGDLDPVDPATVWKSEPTEFIPWLASAKRLAHLSRALGLDLEPMAQEAPVGRFRADLVCRDRGSGTGVVIEAQLGPGDHSHLGQPLTYALGLSAGTVVWLATRFHAEHRVALDGLNEITDGKIRCFAVAMDLWRIGDSHAAPQFTVFAAPPDWPGAVAAPPGHRPPAANAPIAPAGACEGAEGRPRRGDRRDGERSRGPRRKRGGGRRPRLRGAGGPGLNAHGVGRRDGGGGVGGVAAAVVVGRSPCIDIL